MYFLTHIQFTFLLIKDSKRHIVKYAKIWKKKADQKSKTTNSVIDEENPNQMHDHAGYSLSYILSNRKL